MFNAKQHICVIECRAKMKYLIILVRQLNLDTSFKQHYKFIQFLNCLIIDLISNIQNTKKFDIYFKKMMIKRQQILKQNKQIKLRNVFFARIYENFSLLLVNELQNLITQQLRDFDHQKINKAMEQVMHAIGLSALVSLGNPLELIKSRFQTMSQLVDRGTIQNKYKGIIDCVKAIKINQGMRALWKGNSISVLRFFPNETINNDVKNAVKTIIPASPISNIGAGIIGGWTAAGILYPVDTARIFISTSTQRTSETIKKLLAKVQQSSMKFLYRGYSSSLLNIALFRGTYFGVFDSLKIHTKNENEKWLIAYLAGLTAGLTVYPIQTLRKKMIIRKKSMKAWNLIKTTIKNEGVQGFYRGSILTPFQSLCGAVVLMYFDSKQSQF